MDRRVFIKKTSGIICLAGVLPSKVLKVKNENSLEIDIEFPSGVWSPTVSYDDDRLYIIKAIEIREEDIELYGLTTKEQRHRHATYMHILPLRIVEFTVKVIGLDWLVGDIVKINEGPLSCDFKIFEIKLKNS